MPLHVGEAGDVQAGGEEDGHEAGDDDDGLRGRQPGGLPQAEDEEGWRAAPPGEEEGEPGQLY